MYRRVFAQFLAFISVFESAKTQTVAYQSVFEHPNDNKPSVTFVHLIHRDHTSSLIFAFKYATRVTRVPMPVTSQDALPAEQLRSGGFVERRKSSVESRTEMENNVGLKRQNIHQSTSLPAFTIKSLIST